jgi:hypothetical protein
MNLQTRLVSHAVIAAALLALSTLPAAAQQAAATPEQVAEAQSIAAKPRTAPGYVTPRLAIGQPDLQGPWSNASITGLERPSQFKTLVLSEEEAAAKAEVNPLVVRQKTDDNQGSNTAQTGADLNSGRGYNAFWISPGTMFGNVKGDFRTSWIVDPPSGKIPLSAEGRDKVTKARMAGRRGSGFDNPEERGLGERCLLSFAGNGGPVMMNSQYYNDNYRIVQSPTHVIINVEMVHDTRIIPLYPSADAARAAKTPDAIKFWLGKSAGWWEGDTLVVETSGFHPSQFTGGRVAVSDTGKVTERFTRYSDEQVLYEFEINDPALYSQVWKGEMGLNRLAGGMDDVYEYACHEGNYGMEGILAGARGNERNGIANDPAAREEG